MTRTLPPLLVIFLAILVRPTTTHATVYGTDERDLPDAKLSAEEWRSYIATQVVGCIHPNGRWSGGAGSLAGDAKHGVSVAHLFFDENTQTYIPPQNCTFRVYDRDGRKLDEVPIVRLRSRWREQGRGSGNDHVMFALARAPKFVDRLLPLSMAPVYDGEPILLVAFHYDVEPPFTKRKTRGRVYSTLGARDEGALNVFNTDVDCAPMSSGGPIFDSQGRLVGLLRGSSSPGYGPPMTFNAAREFNIAVRFDSWFLAEYEKFRAAHR